MDREHLTNDEAARRGLLRKGKVARYDTGSKKARMVDWQQATSTRLERGQTHGEVQIPLPEGFKDYRKRQWDERLESLTNRLVAEAMKWKEQTGEFYIPIQAFNDIAAEYLKKGMPVDREALRRIAQDILDREANKQGIGLRWDVTRKGWDVPRG